MAIGIKWEQQQSAAVECGEALIFGGESGGVEGVGIDAVGLGVGAFEEQRAELEGLVDQGLEATGAGAEFSSGVRGVCGWLGKRFRELKVQQSCGDDECSDGGEQISIRLAVEVAATVIEESLKFLRLAVGEAELTAEQAVEPSRRGCSCRRWGDSDRGKLDEAGKLFEEVAEQQLCGAACASEAGGGFEKPLLLCEAVFGGWLCVDEKAIFADELEIFLAEEQRLEDVGGCEGFGSSDFREPAVFDELPASLGLAANLRDNFRAFVKTNFERFFGSGIGVRRFLEEPLICGEFREELMGELVAAEVRVRRCEELAGGGLECGDIGAGEFEEFGGEIGVTGGERGFGDAELIDDLLPARGEPEPRSIVSKLCDLLERFDKLGEYGGGGFGECVGCGSGQEFAEKGKVCVATDPYRWCFGTEHGLKSAGGFRVDEASVFRRGEHLIPVGVGID